MARDTKLSPPVEPEIDLAPDFISAAAGNFSRRDALKWAGMMTAMAAIPTFGEAATGSASLRSTKGYGVAYSGGTILRSEKPPVEVMALHRMAFGPRPGDVERVQSMGFASYVHEQLHPVDADDTDCNQRLQALTQTVKYDIRKGKDVTGHVEEVRPYAALTQSVTDLYKNFMVNPDRDPNSEGNLLMEQVKNIKQVRAVYSKWQLREVLTDFWHNHFSINAYQDSPLMRISFAAYDRDVVRANSLGNFRTFLGAVAKSAPMLMYLNNNVSQASPANENYARELFELHTLGAEHYFNDLYQEWSKVPGAAIGKPEGYIDQDVYESARAFTGWTIAQGQYGRGEKLPSTGEFHYYEPWHDPYQKRILAHNIDPYQPPMSDGETVLDLVAYHPGTAHFICKKLVSRFVSPNAPESLVKRAVSEWMANQKDDLQIARVMRVILLSDEFKDTWAESVKMPFEAVIGMIRASGAEFQPTPILSGLFARMGEAQFNWPTPNGRPVTPSYWAGSMGMLSRWQAANLVFASNPKWLTMKMIDRPAGDVQTDGESFAKFWEARILGRPLPESDHAAVVSFIETGGPAPNAPKPRGKGKRPSPALANELKYRQAAALVAMNPEFHVR